MQEYFLSVDWIELSSGLDMARYPPTEKPWSKIRPSWLNLVEYAKRILPYEDKKLETAAANVNLGSSFVATSYDDPVNKVILSRRLVFPRTLPLDPPESPENKDHPVREVQLDPLDLKENKEEKVM